VSKLDFVGLGIAALACLYLAIVALDSGDTVIGVVLLIVTLADVVVAPIVWKRQRARNASK
jgi:hypothetical protein